MAADHKSNGRRPSPFSEQVEGNGREEENCTPRALGGSLRLFIEANDKPIPLSFSQRRLWFLHKIDPDSPIYNRPVMVRLSGPLRIEALQRAVNEIIRRHAALRTTFRETDGEPYQVVAYNAHIWVDTADVTGLEEEESLRRSWQLARDEARRPFDLAWGPLIRSLLIRTGDEEHLLVTTIHHAAFDGWSSQIFLRELSVLYEAFSAGEPSPLEKLPFQYADFAVWQRKRSHAAAFDQQLSFWLERLKDLPVMNLSNASRRSDVPTAAGGRIPFHLPGTLADALRNLAREERATLFMVLLAAFKLLLHRYTGQEDIVLGCPVAGRRRTEVERLIGCFVNTLVLRSNLSGSPSFFELLARIRSTTVDALSNQDVPFERVVDELQPARTLHRTPLFQIFFQLRNYPRTCRSVGSVEMEEMSLDMEATGMDLTLELSEDQDGLSGFFIYSRDLFQPEAVAHMADQYEWLLQQIAAAPHGSVDEYSLVTEKSSTSLPDPSVSLDAPTYEPVTDLIRARASRAPTSVAVRHDGNSWTYAQLQDRSDRIARHLIAGGLKRGAAVGVVGPRSFGTTAALLGVLGAGGVMVPIGNEIPPERGEVMLRDAGAELLICVGRDGARCDYAEHEGDRHIVQVDPGTAEITAEITAETTAETTAEKAERLNAPARSMEHETVDLPRVDPDDPAYIFFTSGTTGRPKGVLGVHKGLSHFLSWQRETFEVGPSDRCAHMTSLSFDVVLRDLFLPLTSGAALCIPPEQMDPSAVLPWLVSEAATIVHVVPSVARMWLDHAATERFSLRYTFFAGEPLTDVLVNRWRTRLGRAGTVVNLYGPTEMTMVKCAYVVPDDPSPGIQPVGSALPHTQALVLRDGNRPCGIYERGEVVLRSKFGTRGYVKGHDVDRACFVPNPFWDEPGDVIYRTGDAGYFQSDGRLVVTGRLDHQIKIRGVRIEPDEIAAALTRHEGVASAVVIGRKEEEGEPMLIAYVVLRSNDVRTAALRSYLAALLPAPMIPASFEFLEALPLTPNGKVDRSRLPEPDMQRGGSTYAPPRTANEKIIAAIWSEVLQREQVGVDDDFFDMGGHSLLIFQITSRMRERLGVDIPVHQFFETPTVAHLAEVVDVMRRASRDDELVQDILQDLDGLSNEQIKRLLKGEN